MLAEYIGAVKAFSFSDFDFLIRMAQDRLLSLLKRLTASPCSTVRPLLQRVTPDQMKRLPFYCLYSVIHLSCITLPGGKRHFAMSLEFRHDQNYAGKRHGDQGSGSAITQLITGAGKPDNTVTAQFDIYF